MKIFLKMLLGNLFESTLICPDISILAFPKYMQMDFNSQKTQNNNANENSNFIIWDE